MAIGRNDLPGATPAERDGVRRLAAVSLLCLLEQDGQVLPDGVGTVDDLIAWAELYASQNPSGLPFGSNWEAATRQLDELLEALGLPDGWALFEAIGRDELPGATPADRATARHAAASTLLTAYQAAGVPLPEAEPTPEALISAAEAEVAAQHES